MNYGTCIGCVHDSGYCHARELVKAKVKGVGVTSIKWKCAHRRPVYQSGDAVWATTFIGYSVDNDGWGRETKEFASFPATVISLHGSKAFMFIEPGATSEGGDYNFEPHSNGYVKIPISRTRRREAIREHVCPSCERVARLHGHEEYCREPKWQAPEEYMF